jgi:hypothetical protein
MICTIWYMVVGGEMKDSGTNGTRETDLFLLLNERWCLVD